MCHFFPTKSGKILKKIAALNEPLTKNKYIERLYEIKIMKIRAIENLTVGHLGLLRFS
jgi:hypothetical protein